MIIIPFYAFEKLSFATQIVFTNDASSVAKTNNFNNDNRYNLYDDVDVDAYMGASKGYI